MEEEHTPTIIQLIRSTDLAVIQFKDSHIYSSYSQQLEHQVDNQGLVLLHLKLARPETSQNPLELERQVMAAMGEIYQPDLGLSELLYALSEPCDF